MKIVDISEVPSGRTKSSKWSSLFEKIPPEKALVISEGEISFNAIRTALYALQRKGKFKNLQARKVKETNGKYAMYIVNNAKLESHKP